MSNVLLSLTKNILIMENQEITLRDHFAGLAMQGIISNADTMREITKAWTSTKPSERPAFSECIAGLSFEYSDAMLKQRSL